ncbi:MAG: beta-ketoacyl reductase, partial [Myxococcota bacterium]
AGLLDDALLADQSVDQFRRVLAPKLAGAWNLHQVTRELDLDWFVLYSSVVALLGSPGQSNYAAANAFLDALAHHRRHLGLPALALGWGPFAEVGLAAADDNRGARLAGRGMQLLTPADGQTLFARLVASDTTYVAPCPFDVHQWLEFYPAAAGWPFLDLLAAEDSGAAALGADHSWLDAALSAPPEEAREHIIAHVLGELGQVLRTDPAGIDPATPFKALGVDSLMGMELRNRLQASTGQTLSSTAVWTYPTPQALGGLLADNLLGAAASGATNGSAPSSQPSQDLTADRADSGLTAQAAAEAGNDLAGEPAADPTEPTDQHMQDLLLDELEDLEELLRD